jgi:hypothetical protein
MLSLSARNLQTLLFIILPAITISLLIYDGYVKSGEFVSSAITDPIRLFALRVLPIALIIYGLYPAVFTNEKYFQKIGFQNVVMEFQYIYKILCTEIVILSVSALISILILYIPFSFPSQLELDNIIILPIMFQMLFCVIGGILRINSQVAKKEFWLYFAKGCLKISSENQDDLEKTHYLILGLSSYNKYLRRHLKYQIQDKYIVMISSNFMRINSEGKKQTIELLHKALEDTRSAPVGCLLTILKLPLTEQFLGRESLVQKLKAPGAALVAGIPVIISIIQLISSSGR